MKLLVFDGNSVINRAFYAIKGLTTRRGEPTGALFGFLRLYFKYLEMSKPDMVAVAFDVHAKTFRHKMYDAYKATRRPQPEELTFQIEALKELLSAMNVKRFELEGYEADDVIGTLSAYCEARGCECDIVSGDRDDFQLISERTRVIMPVTRGGMSEVEICDKAYFLQNYGFEPKRLIDLKAIMGDSSDNIKGVPGIGEKGALELIRRFGSLDGVYAALDDIKPATAKKLAEGKESAYKSYKLATILRDLPLEINDDDLKIKECDGSRLTPLLERYELTSIAERLGMPAAAEKRKTAEPQVTEKTAEELLPELMKNGLYFLPDGGAILADTGFGVCRVENYLSLFENPDIEKFTFEAKSLYKSLPEGIEPFYDIAVAQYVIDPSAAKYELADIFYEYTGMRASSPAALATGLREIVKKQRGILERRGQKELLYNIELPLTVVLSDMEKQGFTVDREALLRYSEKLAKMAAEAERRIYELAGEEFNINSPKQLGVILFEKLGLPHGKKTKKGYSTNAEILSKLENRHEIVGRVLEYRRYVKLKSTYCDGLLGLIGQDGRIHTSFNQTVTLTGRISSAEPNLQNIPVRTELGRELRAMFAAADGCVLVDADYSQIELRVLAHMANDRAMLEAFERGEDIHAVTAASVFGVTREMVTPEMRRFAKAVNFGIVYGISDFSLAQDIGVSRKQAREYIEGYLAHYSGVKEYMKNIVQKAREDGFVVTLSGRRRELPELKSQNFNIRSFGERAALNTPIQGTAADIIKTAMVNTHRALQREGLSARLILQVHDELIIEAPENEREQVERLLVREMENAMKLNVKLTVDVKWGRTWYECK